MRLAVVKHVVVDFVRHHRDIGMALQSDDELVDFRFRRHAAGGIGRRVENEEPRLRRDEIERFLGGEGEIVFLADRHRDRPRAGELDHRAIDRKARIGIEDVGARLAEHQDRHEHGRLAAGKDHHRVRRDADRKALVQVGGDRLAQRQDADRRRVAVMTVAQRLDRCLDDKIRRAEIGLADAEIDDVAALRRKLRRARKHGESVFLAEPVEGGNGSQHGRHFSVIARQRQMPPRRFCAAIPAWLLGGGVGASGVRGSAESAYLCLAGETSGDGDDQE